MGEKTTTKFQTLAVKVTSFRHQIDPAIFSPRLKTFRETGILTQIYLKTDIPPLADSQ